MANDQDQQSALTEQRFYSAVNVIRGLPKNGSYQPSHDMQLRFYSFFKQATEGRCNQKRPGIWNPVARAKWEAWTKLGNMPRDDAMNNYVEELKKIIETMSYTDNVADFMGSVSELDGVSVADLEAVAPEAIQKVRSRPNSPFASREASPIRAPLALQNGSAAETSGHNGYLNHHQTNGLLNEAVAQMNGNGYLSNGGGHTTEQSDDEYIDTIDDYDNHSFHSDSTMVTSSTAQMQSHASRTKVRFQPGSDSRPLLRGGRMESPVAVTAPPSLEVDLRFHNVLSQLNATVERINADVQMVMSRVMVVERQINETAKAKSSMAVVAKKKYPKWWPFQELSPNWVIFIVLWPFVAHKLMKVVGGGSRRK